MRSFRPTSVVGLLFLAACAGNAIPERPEATPAPAALSATAWEATIAPRAGSGAEIRGRIRLYPTTRAGELDVEGDLRGARPRGRIAWRIMQGDCTSIGTPVAATRAPRDLTVNELGASLVEGRIVLTLPDEGSHQVAIFADSVAPASFVACGVLEPLP